MQCWGISLECSAAAEANRELRIKILWETGQELKSLVCAFYNVFGENIARAETMWHELEIKRHGGTMGEL